MIDFDIIKKDYPLAFKKMQNYFNDGIGHCDVRHLNGFGYVLWWYGDSDILDRRINDYELYNFFDQEAIYVIVKLNSLSSRAYDFVYDVSIYQNGIWDGIKDEESYLGSSRQNAQDDAFEFAFEKLNKRLIQQINGK